MYEWKLDVLMNTKLVAGQAIILSAIGVPGLSDPYNVPVGVVSHSALCLLHKEQSP